MVAERIQDGEPRVSAPPGEKLPSLSFFWRFYVAWSGSILAHSVLVAVNLGVKGIGANFSAYIDTAPVAAIIVFLCYSAALAVLIASGLSQNKFKWYFGFGVATPVPVIVLMSLIA